MCVWLVTSELEETFFFVVDLFIPSVAISLEKASCFSIPKLLMPELRSRVVAKVYYYAVEIGKGILCAESLCTTHVAVR